MFIVSLPAGAHVRERDRATGDRTGCGLGVATALIKRLPCGPSAGAAAADSASPRREVSGREAAATV